MLRALRNLLLLAGLACRASSPAVSGDLLDDAGTRTVLSATPRRVVSLIPATTELLFALGAGDRVVGRTAWCDYPAEAAAVPNLGNGIDPNIEAVVGARPELVLLYKSGANRGAAERLRGLGIPVLELATDRIADIGRITRLLGRALDLEDRADSVATAVDRDLAAATVDSTRQTGRPRVFILAWDRPAMTLGRGSFLSEIVERAGGRNVFDDVPSSSAQISIEAVAARDPDLVLISSSNDPVIASRAEWQVVRAVRERRFLRVMGSEFNRPSPRVGQAVRELAATLRAVR